VIFVGVAQDHPVQPPAIDLVEERVFADCRADDGALHAAVEEPGTAVRFDQEGGTPLLPAAAEYLEP
jgi:hypothetical protein